MPCGHSETNVYTPYISGNYVKFWGLPTTIHVLYIHRSQNKVLGIRGLVTLFFNIIICTFYERNKEGNKRKEKRKKTVREVSNSSTISYIISRYMLSGAGVASPSQVCAPAMLILLSERTVS
jgi:hypothetical protein